MSIIALIDIANTSFCIAAGLYTLYKLGILDKSIKTPEVATIIVLVGCLAWLFNCLMAAMTIVDADLISFDVYWSPNVGYTTCRLMHMVGWLYLLKLIRQSH